MKHDVMRSHAQDPRDSRVQIEAPILKKLVTEVRETVATDIEFRKKSAKKVFGVNDLWNIRRKVRYAARSRKQPTIVTGIRG